MGNWKQAICVLFGAGGVITFLCTLKMPILFAGEYMILAVIVVVASLHFYEKFAKPKQVSTYSDNAYAKAK